MIGHYTGFVCLAILITAVPAAGQNGPPKGGPYVRLAPAVEFFAGHAGFADDATIEHSVFGGAARFYLSPRLAVGPEVTYMRGPGFDRDLFVMGNLTFDILGPRRVAPFLIAGGGFSRFSTRIGPIPFSSGEGAFSAGGGTRIWIGDRVYGTVDFRIGWELHYRVTGGIGVALR